MADQNYSVVDMQCPAFIVVFDARHNAKGASMRRFLMFVLWLLIATTTAQADPLKVRVAALKFGTVNWLLDTIKANGLDTKAGYELEVVGLAGTPATKIAFQSGDADILVTDWVWALHKREQGASLRFSPYSSALGALIGQAGLQDLCDLKGRTIGVVGGRYDKSWLVLQALSRKRCGFDLAEETETLFGAPPLMARQLQQGTVDAVVTYWHWAAKLEAAGQGRIMGVTEALLELEIDPAPAMIGFVWDSERIAAQTLQSFYASVGAARRILATDDAEWERLRPRMKPKSEAEFLALRDTFRAGEPQPWSLAETEAAARLHKLLIDNAGQGFAGGAGRFDPDLFYIPNNDG